MRTNRIQGLEAARANCRKLQRQIAHDADDRKQHHDGTDKYASGASNVVPNISRQPEKFTAAATSAKDYTAIQTVEAMRHEMAGLRVSAAGRYSQKSLKSPKFRHTC